MGDHEQSFKAAVIGLGFIGAGDPVSGEAIGQDVANLDGTHAQVLAQHPHVELVAGASRDEGRRKRFEQRTGVVRTYADWREMLDVVKPDIVSVATYSPQHAALTAACAEAGAKAVFCEKPIATRLTDADHAMNACRIHNTLLVVNHQRRWHPLWRAARDAIRNGAVGNIRHAVAHWPTGRLGNVGTHVFDALCMLLDDTPCAVSASLDPIVPPDCRGDAFHDPGGWGVIGFSKGTRAFVDAPHDAICPLLIRIVGDGGQITVSNDLAVVQPWNGDAKPLIVSLPRASSLALGLDDMVRCLVNGDRPASTGEDAMAALEIIAGFHASHRTNAAWVNLPLDGEPRELEIKIG
jgi:predicted dehydrogenase